MSVLHIILDIGDYDHQPSNTFPGFAERMVSWLPGLEKHECSVGRPGGFIERLHRGTYLAHIAEHVALELQNLMGFPVAFGRARALDEPGLYRVILAYKEETPARAAFDTALRLTLAAMHDTPFDVQAEIEQLLTLADDYRLGPSTGAIVRAAEKRDIPVIRLTPTGSLVQLGYGVYQKRILASETSNTSSIAVEMCQEKPLTNSMLRTVGVPVPEGLDAASADEACAAANAIGYPVVVKPIAGNQGKGVSVNLHSEEDVRAAYAVAAAFDVKVLVERFVTGHDYRLLVINGKLVAAARRDAANVVGDGAHTIEQLIAMANQDPRRRPGHSGTLTYLQLDDAACMVLAQQGLKPEDIPEPGQVVRLRTNCNLSTGGTATDVTDDVHPRNAQVAALAAQILALDVAGIDIVCQDISRPLHEQGGAVVEVNAAPGLRMHVAPTSGQPRDVATPIIDMLFPASASARIPIIAVTGTNGKTTVTSLISHMYTTARWVVGMTSTEGTYINKERVLSGDCSGPRSARAVLLHPHVEVAVLETARGGILREGLAFDSCSVGVVTNISADHLGLDDVNTLDELARVKQVVVEAVADDGAAVLNADDPLVAEMAAATRARVVYFSANPQNHVIAAHLAEGESAVIIRDGTIVLATGEIEIELTELERVPFTDNGRIRFQVMNALAAVAAAWAAGLNPAMIVRALATFITDTSNVPGRFNVMNINGIQVVLDYGHNPAAIAALMEAIETLGRRRTMMVIGLPGDRQDEDLLATMRATTSRVDSYILHDLHDRRERAQGEVPRLISRAIPPHVPYRFAGDQQEAIDEALAALHPGDRLIVIADVVDETIAILEAAKANDSEDSACRLSPVEERTVRPV